ncbi:MAG: YoaK family protein [Lachnospiraceae bacterium]|nr:YoaK family protein [Lachnospiraceae bacterium]
MLENDEIKRKEERLVTMMHHCMAVVGGFMGGYAILIRADFLGNAQTSNLIYLLYAVFGRDFFHVLLRVLAVALYVAGTMLYVMMKNKTGWNIPAVAIGVDCVAVLIEGFIPGSVDPVLALLPIFFSMSLQWNAFPGNYGYVSSTIFSTNNLKQTTLAFSEYLCDKDRKHLHKMKFFLGSLISFHIGVAVSYFCTGALAERGIWLNLPVLGIAAVLVWQRQAVEKEMKNAVKPAMNYVKEVSYGEH